MPSPSKSQLNLSVDGDLKDKFKRLCDAQSISLAKAFESFMAQCVQEQQIISIPSPSISPSLDIDGKIENAIQDAIAPIQEKLLRLVEIVEALQQSVDNATLESDEVIEDNSLEQGITSASLSMIFEEPDAIINCANNPKDIASSDTLEHNPDAIALELEKSEMLNTSKTDELPAENSEINPLLDLDQLKILELKKLASGKIKRYSNLTKSELVERLAPLGLRANDLAIALQPESE